MSLSNKGGIQSHTSLDGYESEPFKNKLRDKKNNLDDSMNPMNEQRENSPLIDNQYSNVDWDGNDIKKSAKKRRKVKKKKTHPKIGESPVSLNLDDEQEPEKPDIEMGEVEEQDGLFIADFEDIVVKKVTENKLFDLAPSNKELDLDSSKTGRHEEDKLDLQDYDDLINMKFDDKPKYKITQDCESSDNESEENGKVELATDNKFSSKLVPLKIQSGTIPFLENQSNNEPIVLPKKIFKETSNSIDKDLEDFDMVNPVPVTQQQNKKRVDSMNFDFDF